MNRLSSYGFLQNAAFFSIVVAGMYLPYWWLRMNECNVCLEKREKFFLSYMYGHGHPVRDSFKNIPIVLADWIDKTKSILRFFVSIFSTNSVMVPP